MLKKKRLKIIREHYPNALTTIDSINKIIDYIEAELDLEPSQMMLAESVCSDDVNSIQHPFRALEFLGPFKMGGLDGFPFTGLSGMNAFADHVPDGGAVFIYYGPHIGITREGDMDMGSFSATKRIEVINLQDRTRTDITPYFFKNIDWE